MPPSVTLLYKSYKSCCRIKRSLYIHNDLIASLCLLFVKEDFINYINLLILVGCLNLQSVKRLMDGRSKTKPANCKSLHSSEVDMML